MTSAFDADLASLAAREDLTRISHLLLAAARLGHDLRFEEGSVELALRRHGPPTASSWPRLLDDVARGLGLRVTWRQSSAEHLAEEVQPDLPAVAWTPRGWCVVQRPRADLQVHWVPGGERAHGFDASDMGEGVVTWALVEDALPGGVLGGRGPLPPWRRLLGLLRAERADLTLVLVYALAAGILALATPVAVQVFVNTIAFGAFRQPLVWLSAMLLTALGLSALLRAVQRWVVELLQRRVFVRMVADLAERLPRVRVEAYDRDSGPELVNRFFDVLTVQKSMSSLLLDGLGASLQAAVGMLLLALYHPALLGFDVLLLGAILALLGGLGQRGQDTAVVESKKKYAVASWLEEIAARPAQYKLGGGAELAGGRADELARSWLGARNDHFSVFFVQYSGALALQAFAQTVLLATGGWLVLDGQLTLGQLVAAELVVASVLVGFAKFSEKLEVVYDLLAAVDKLGQLVDLPLERSHGSRPDVQPGPVDLLTGSLSWANEAGAVVPVALDVRVPPGEHLVLVGADGSGRSALADVLLGLREPTGGRVEVDGTDLADLRLDALRDQVALVRGWEHVSGSVADNVALGRAGIDRRAVRRALDLVGLGDMVAKLPDGLDTVLYASGMPLSDGQRARLAVARAIAGSPRLLVVDGLFDHVGPTDRDAVIGALVSEGSPWTLIVLTRDASLVGPGIARVVDLSAASIPASSEGA